MKTNCLLFGILIIHKPSLGTFKVPHKFWARWVQPFLRLMDTNISTHTRTSHSTLNATKFSASILQINAERNESLVEGEQSID